MARDMARGIAALIGLLLVAIGALGLVENPLVGEHGVFVASPLLDLANLAIGLGAIAVSFTRHEADVWNGLLGLGGLAIVLVALLTADPSLGGLLAPSGDIWEELVYAVVGLVALSVGVAARATGEERGASDEW